MKISKAQWKSFAKRQGQELFCSLGVRHVILKEVCVECLGGTPSIWLQGVTFGAGCDKLYLV